MNATATQDAAIAAFRRDPSTALLRGAVRRANAIRRRMHGAMRDASGRRVPYMLPEYIAEQNRAINAALPGF